MKIQNIENGIKKLHIQKEDLILLQKLYTGLLITSQKFSHLENDKDKNSFITITNEHDIELINCISFIIDYRYYRNLKKQDLKNEIKLIKRKNLNKEITKHIIKQLQQIIDFKENNSNIELPFEIDYYGYHHTGTEDNYPYIISTGIDPNTFFFYRKDQTPLTITDNLSTNFIEKALLINRLQRSKQDEIISSYKESFSTTPDQKYFVITIEPQTLNKNKNLIKSIKRNLQQK